jgi:hypothetical protein
MTIEQRAGVSSGLIIWPEKAGFPAVDPATPPFYGYVAPLSGEEGVNTDRPLVEVPLFKRNRRAFAHLLGMSGAGGSASINLDTRFFGHMASLFMGLDKYSRKGGRHIWGVGTPLSCQTEKQSTESPILYIRQPGQKVNTLDFGSSQVGPVVYSAQFMGKGSELYTGLEAAGGTVVDETFEPLSYLNGQVQKGTGVLGTIITEYSMSMTQNLQRTDARFSDKAAAIVAGNPAANGRLGIMYVDNGFYLEGVNSTSLYFEMIWSNRAADDNPTQWVRFMFPKVLFSKGTPKFGGRAGVSVVQDWQMDVAASAGIGAELLSSPVSTWPTIDASNDKIRLSVSGGGLITQTLPHAGAGASVPATVAAALAFTGTTVDTFMGRLRIRTSSVGAATSLDIDPTVGASGDVAIGIDAAVHPGYDGDMFIEVQNDQTSDYAAAT